MVVEESIFCRSALLMKKVSDTNVARYIIPASGNKEQNDIISKHIM
jgi:hypothetical protein